MEGLEHRRLLANQPPFAPEIALPGSLVNFEDVHMESRAFADPDVGDAHSASDWEIWDLGAANGPERVWHARGVAGIDKTYINLADGSFENGLLGRNELDPESDYELRTRHRDSSGDAATQWSPWSVKAFRTLPDLPPVPGEGDWITLSDDYVVEVVADDLWLPSTLAFVPEPTGVASDPLYYVVELHSGIKVVTHDGTVSDFKTDLLNYTPPTSFPGNGEQGLGHVVVDPATGDLIVGRLVHDDNVGRTYPEIIRIESLDGGLRGGEITTLLSMPQEWQSQAHHIGNMAVGPDGKLWVGNGDGFGGHNGTSLNPDSYRGKILRLNLDGTPAADNPWYDATDGINARDYSWNRGVRNPWGGTFRPANDAYYFSDTGPQVDRLARATRGTHFQYDGTNASMRNGAIYNWEDGPAPASLVWLDRQVFNGSGFPEEMMDTAFAATTGGTYSKGPSSRGKRIEILPVSLNDAYLGEPSPLDLVKYNGTGRATVVGLAAGPDGLYFTDLYRDDSDTAADVGGRVLRVRYVGDADQAPDAPTSLNAAARDANSVRLSWRDNSNNESGFDIEAQRPNGVWMHVADVDADVTTFLHTNLAESTLYRYRVRAHDADGNDSSYSNVAEVTTPTAGQRPFHDAPVALPGTVAAVDFDEGGPGVAYSDNTPGNTFGVYRDGDVDIAYFDGGTTNPAATGYVVDDLTSGEWLEYTVDVAEAGRYPLTLVLAGESGAAQTALAHVEVDGVDATGQIRVLDGAEQYVGNVWLEAGERVIRLAVDATTDGGEMTPVAGLRFGEPIADPDAGNGLKAAYYDNRDFTGTRAQRLDAQIMFDWGGVRPDPAIEPNNFSVRWTGQVRTERAGEYQFHVTGDDGVRLWVDGELIVDGWGEHPATEYTGSVTLEADRKYEIRLDYFQGGGGAVAELRWTTPGGERKLIPTANLYPDLPEVDEPGTGLPATYFDSYTAGGPVIPLLERTDAAVSFDWTGVAPDPSMEAVTFAARWEGRLRADHAETYTVHVTSDDGVRLWLDGELVVDDWNDHPLTTHTVDVALDANTFADVRLEYYQNGGGAGIDLSWESASTPLTVIPTANLYGPDDGSGTGGGGPLGGDGLTATYFDDADLSGESASRIDPQVYFDWTGIGPTPDFAATDFSARWTGQVLAELDATHTFHVSGDDGVRLWVDGELLVDAWVDQPLTEYSGSLDLLPGERYDLVLEYYQHGGGAGVQLAWSAPALPRQIIPQDNLFSEAPLAPSGMITPADGGDLGEDEDDEDDEDDDGGLFA